MAQENKRSNKKWYAWTDIPLKPKIDPKTNHITDRPLIGAGKAVSLSILGVDQEEFDKLVRERVIRSTPMPEGIKRYEAPKQTMLRKAREMMEEAERGGQAEVDAFDNANDENNDDGDPNAPDGETEEERLVRLGMEAS